MAGKDDTKRFEVTCPLCRGVLTIDAATGIVLHAATPAGQEKDFEAALGEVRRASGSREEQLARAFQQERARRASLDRKFETAQEKAAAEPDKRRINPLDLD
jgi:hypothetical protein